MHLSRGSLLSSTITCILTRATSDDALLTGVRVEVGGQGDDGVCGNQQCALEVIASTVQHKEIHDEGGDE